MLRKDREHLLSLLGLAEGLRRGRGDGQSNPSLEAKEAPEGDRRFFRREWVLVDVESGNQRR